MGDLYSSAIGTTVLQSKELFSRPMEFEGELCLFGMRDGVSESAVRRAFLGCESVDLKATPPIVRYATHAAALQAIETATLADVCDGVGTRYNERPYDERGWWRSATSPARWPWSLRSS